MNLISQSCVRFFGISFVLVFFFDVAGGKPPIKSSAPNTPHINWKLFLGRNDMIWKRLPDSWDKAPFVGNGRLGTIFWLNSNGRVCFEISRSDVYDHRDSYYIKDVLFSSCRLPNGHFELVADSFFSGQMRLNLWDAEVSGEIRSGRKRSNFRCFTHSLQNVIVIELDNSMPLHLNWYPDSSKSTRHNPPLNLVAYPAQYQTTSQGVNVSVQEMPDSSRYCTKGKQVGQYATAWRLKREGSKCIYYISMGFSYPGRNAIAEAVTQVNSAYKQNFKAFIIKHRQWWHAYYPKSFLSVPDAAMESFYWVQMYKMASASRKGGPILDLLGPWFRITNWPAIWWNLNVQLTYWPFYISNHLEEAEPLRAFIWEKRKSFLSNAKPFSSTSYAVGRATGPDGLAPVGNELGNFPWVLHNLWLHYRSCMDDDYLKQQLFPLMKGSFNYFLHISNDSGQKFSLPSSSSPEFTLTVENSTYSAACFRWLASAIIQTGDRFHLNDSIVVQAKETLAKLVPYEVDSSGFLIGKNMPLSKSHRHWSHLFPIYPFKEITFTNPTHRKLVESSVNNWTSKFTAFTGYSWLGAAAMKAAEGKSDTAMKYLQTFLKKYPENNTFYLEGSPVIETPLAYARVLQELVLSVHDSLIDIFSGVPESWSNVSFENFRAEGGFLVSAVKSGGLPRLVKIKSLAGEPCRVRVDLGNIVRIKERTIKFKRNGNVLNIDLKKGQIATLYSERKYLEKGIVPVASKSTSDGRWGENNPYN